MNSNGAEAQIWLDSGLQHSRLGKYDEALKCYERAIALDPGYDTAWFNRGTTLAKLNDIEGAIKCFTKAIHLFPTDPDYYINLGLAYGTVENYSLELEAYRKALALDSEANLGTLYFNMAICLSKLESQEEALHFYTKAIVFNKYDFQAYFNRAVVLIRLRQYKQALEDLDQSIKLSPEASQSIQLRDLVGALYVPANRDKLPEMLAYLSIILEDL